MTTTDTPAATPTPPQPAPKKRRGRWWKILLALVLFILILILLAPTILSTAFGTSIILGQINKRIAGKIEASDISLGWFSGASLRNLRLLDPDGHEVLNIPTLNTNLTLLDAINKSFNNLNLLLRGKSATLVTNPDGTSNLSRALASPTAKTPATTAPANNNTASSTPQTIHATIDAQYDAISINSPNAAPVTLSNLTTKGTLDTNGGTTDLHLSANAASGNNPPATLTANANGIFFDHGKLKPLGSITGTADAHAQSIDLAALSPFLTTAGLKLTITGNSNIDFNLSQNAGAQVATSKVTVNNLTATGDLLKGDTLKRNQLTLNLDAALKGESVDLRSLQLATSDINAQLSGTLLTSTAPTAPLPPLTIKSNIDVAALKKDLPHLLASVPDTQLTLALTGIADTAKKLFTTTADSTITEKDPASNKSTTLALAKNSVLSWGNNPDDIHATATINWQRLQQLAAKSLPEGTTLQGTRTIPIHLAGSITNAPGLNAFKNFTLDPTTIGWDQISSEGLTLGKADVGIQLKNGLLSLTPTNIPASGGTLHLAGRVDLNQTPAAYILDKGANPLPIIEKLQLNKQIAAGPLAFLPLSWGAGGADKNNPTLGDVSGELNVSLNGAFIPLNADAFKQKAATAGALNISNLSTNAPFFSQLLTALGPIAKITQPDILNIRGANIPNTPFNLANGKVSYQNLTLGTAKQSIQFSGSVGLDKSLAMNVQIAASGLTIPIPVGLSGTTTSPQLSINANPLNADKNNPQNLNNTINGATSVLEQLLNKNKDKKKK
ncbi:MAG: hypothetical protein ACTHN5_01100 [Phycisphaerae bacterium]